MKNATVKKAALLILLIMMVMGIAYPTLAPFQPDDFSSPALLPPGGKHLLGTNKMGQDIFSALLALYWLVSGSPSASRLLFLFVPL